MELEIRSEGLSLRPLREDAVEAVHELWTDAAVRRYLWDGELIPLERTRQVLRENEALFEERGLGIWGVHRPSADELLGFAGYWLFRDPPALELLFGVASAHWGRGIATTASRRVIRYGLEELGLPRVEASTDVANVASIRVLEKLGMERRRRAVVDGLDTVFYELARGAPADVR